MITTTTALQALTACQAACERIIEQEGQVHFGIDFAALLGSVRAALSALAAQDAPSERKAAEHAYITTAFDYASAPVGSRDWGLFFDGWRARASQPATPAQDAAATVPKSGWKEAAIAWNVCASIHETWAKGKDALYTTRQADFKRHFEEARTKALAAPTAPQAHDERTELAMQRLGDLLVKALGAKHEALDDWAHVMFALRAAAPQAPALVPLTDAEFFVRHLLWDLHPECCGRGAVGGDYLGLQEWICCCQPEMDMLNDAQIVASLRERFPEHGITPATKEQQ